jgi:hypothetical protein
MSPEKLSASELLEEARNLRAAADADGRAMFDAREGEILRLAAAIEENRRRSGIAGVVDDFLGSILGEKRQAENRLAELRAREAKVEALLRERVGAQATASKANEILERTKTLAASARQAATPAGLRQLFEKRVWAMGEVNFYAHAIEAAREAAAAKALAEGFDVFVQAATDATANAAANLSRIEAELKSFKK